MLGLLNTDWLKVVRLLLYIAAHLHLSLYLASGPEQYRTIGSLTPKQTTYVLNIRGLIHHEPRLSPHLLMTQTQLGCLVVTMCPQCPTHTRVHSGHSVHWCRHNIGAGGGGGGISSILSYQSHNISQPPQQQILCNSDIWERITKLLSSAPSIQWSCCSNSLRYDW